MQVRKAVIPAAGLGTRFLPASKAVPKELITVVDRPVIQYGVEELVRAGITDICIVVSEGKESVAEHFGRNDRLESALRRAGKKDALQQLRGLSEIARISTVRQDEPLGLGHAVWIAREYIQDEPFVVVLPDELFDPKHDLIGSMVQTFEQRGASVVAVVEVPHAQVHAYGVIEPHPSETEAVERGLIRVKSVVEKPHPDRAPSDYALCGRYVLTPDVFGIISGLEPGSGGEIQLADALGVLAGQRRLWAYEYAGRRWDVGNKPGYLEAVVALALDHPELGPEFSNLLSRLSHASR